MILNNNFDPKYSFLKIFILFFLLISSFYLKVPTIIFNKLNYQLNNIRKSRLIKTNNCSIETISKIPNNSTIIIGHLYGSPENHNNFIDTNTEELLIKNKSRIKNLFLTGDIFYSPDKKKWEKLFNLYGDNMNIIIAPGNHDVGTLENLKIFNDSIKQDKYFPIIFEDNNNVFIFENSIESGWKIDANIFSKINSIEKNKTIFLLRHNIAAKELILLANTNGFLDKNLHNFEEINRKLNRKIIIISGDGGAFEKLPRVFCRTEDKVKHIINGIGGIKGDSLLIINNKKLYKYIIN
tara:strand:- start:507 stop:1391 length:885 start_codon:yes stop_codon:yes gene_type:complete